ncbi:MAG TPA: hypothetical protein VGM65_00875 [Candidatus Udaeobacter sp.]|jgi:hypothetical protein
MGERVKTRNLSSARSYEKTAALAARLFDHLLRNDESYTQKWEYVRENPVRAGLVPLAADWPYQGEFVFIDRA